MTAFRAISDITVNYCSAYNASNVPTKLFIVSLFRTSVAMN